MNPYEKMKKEELLQKFFDNQCSIEELKILLDLLKEDHDEHRYNKVLEEAWHTTDATPKEKDDLTAFIQNVESRIERYTPKEKPVTDRFFARHMISYAAAVVFLCIVVVVVVWRLSADETVYMTYQTTDAEIREVMLPDQSVVTLNANSSLQVGKDFQRGGVREVWLNGEAFFSVTHLDSHQKFVVHTEDLDVEVLGTEFNVNNRRERTSVVLNSGKVRLMLDEKKESVVMQPGDFVEFSRIDRRVMHRKVEPEKYNAWMEHTLVFESTPLPEVLEILEDIYGYSIVVTDGMDLSSYSLTSKVSSRQPEILLQIIEKTFELKVERNGDKIRIKK